MESPNTQRPDHQYRLLLTVRLSELPGIRRKITGRLRLWDLEHLADDTCAIVTELLANVHRHADGRAVLLLRRWPGRLLITVSDRSRELPAAKEPDWIAESGRGLCIVDALADWWRAEPTATGKDITASLACRENVRALW
ncbi:ATP-binding protein [Streptomyces paludis]|uniref:ATP-binding protein n=1 Tax=Streptomyces paludis TaxID=2282738 RepID=A0A345HWD5_9ACTN|nr:ATP-binding protein [Streptomyces paludis]AXG81009.1 ATP-binding protein [Streptomyces paludis]